MLKVSICPAVVEDAEAIAQLNESCLGQKTPVAAVERMLKMIIPRADEKLFVAVYHGRMIGYIHARDDLRTYRAPQKAVLTVAVDKDYRRKGVGTALFEAVAAWGKQTRCEAVTASVGSSKAAQSFFAACGFTERLNHKPYFKSLEEPRSPIIERLEQNGKKV